VLRPLSRHEIWVRQAQLKMEEGDVAAAREVLQRALLHSKAFEDGETQAMALHLLARLALLEGQCALAIQLEQQAQTFTNQLDFWCDSCLAMAGRPLSPFSFPLSHPSPLRSSPPANMRVSPACCVVACSIRRAAPLGAPHHPCAPLPHLLCSTDYIVEESLTKVGGSSTEDALKALDKADDVFRVALADAPNLDFKISWLRARLKLKFGEWLAAGG